MKSYFIVSADKCFYPLPNDQLSLIDPHIEQINEKLLQQYSYKVLSFKPLSYDEFCSTSHYVLKKYYKYRKLLANDLNFIHNEIQNEMYWAKCFGLELKRYISLVYKAYRKFKIYSPENFNIHCLLDEKSFIIPDTFEDQRTLLQHTDIGYEQLFAIYIKLFYPKIYTGINKIELDENHFDPIVCTERINLRLNETLDEENETKVGIFGSGLLPQYADKLMFHKNINYLNFDLNSQEMTVEGTDRQEYKFKIEIEDEFDEFFMASLQTLFPRFFLEQYHSNKKYFLSEITKYKHLKFIINEYWLSNTKMNFLLALAGSQGIKHIYNEHNTLTHSFLGNNIELIAELVDIYFTLGWQPKEKQPNIIAGASLYFERDYLEVTKEYKYLFLDVAVFARLEEFTAKYSESEELALIHLQMIKTFFSYLTQDIFKDIVYRGYPLSKHTKWKMYNNRKILKNKFGPFDKYDIFSTTAVNMMKKSRLVIIAYTNTSYIECMLLNIPMILLLNKYAYLDEKYKNFFNELIKAKICFIDVKEAAEFINSLGDNIEKWWYGDVVQSARKLFLLENIGEPTKAIDFYKKLADTL